MSQLARPAKPASRWGKPTSPARSRSPGGDVYPRVFATSRMIALMEIAASRAMNHHLDAGELSVGVTVDVEHTAPTPHGARVVARSRLIEREGNLFVFEVIAEDEAGEIGRGRHKRAVVEDARLVSGAERRRRL